MIKIETEKIVVRGKKCRKIIAIAMLTSDGTPEIYTEIDKSVYLDVNNRQVIYSDYPNGSNENSQRDWYFLEVNKIYPESIFIKKTEIIRRCGQRLHEINKKLEIENANWTGEETIVI